MDFVSPLESPLNCCPKFHFMHQWKPQPERKKFPSHWSGIQEFIFRKVRSQAKLCYLGMLPKYRSVLFWIMKPLVVTLFPDIWDEKIPVQKCVFYKGGLPSTLCLQPSFPGHLNTDLQYKGQVRCRGPPLSIYDQMVFTCLLKDNLGTNLPQHLPNSFPQMLTHLFFFRL